MIRPKRHTVKTIDGWSLALYHYPTYQRTSRWGPVLLVHGLGANRYNLDAPIAEISVAQYLREIGHDVWVVELRGAGRSRPSTWPLKRSRMYDFDDYVHKDVPAVVRHILDHSGSPHLHWVGHSMGGMLAYAALIHFDNRLFRSVTTLGSPAFTGVKHPLVDKVHRLAPLLNVIRWLPYRPAGYAAMFFPQMAVTAMGKIAANPENLNPEHIRILGPKVLHSLPSALLKQFAQWYESGSGFSRTDGLLGYWEHLERIRSPIMVIAGGGDPLTPVSDLVSVYDAVSSADKKLLICDRAHGFSVDYGHIDLILGTRARDEIYPQIADWIESHG